MGKHETNISPERAEQLTKEILNDTFRCSRWLAMMNGITVFNAKLDAENNKVKHERFNQEEIDGIRLIDYINEAAPIFEEQLLKEKENPFFSQK